MIRQAISCDICAREMQNPNHWFVAYDRGAELRVIRWGFRSRLRAGARHLCGQTCLHKLVDEFMTRPAEFMARPAVASGAAIHEEKQPASPANGNITFCGSSLDASKDIADGFESSARLIQPNAPQAEPAAALTLMPRMTPAEAWKREREREQRAATLVTRSARSQSIA